MRATRLLALALVGLIAPLSRSAAQTCEGSAAFQDGRMRVGAFYQDNSDRNDVGAQLAFGIPRSFFGTLTLDSRYFPSTPQTPPINTVNTSKSSYLGGGAELGYQVHLSDTPFQVCPAVSWHVADGGQGSEFGFGGSIGYRVPISTWLITVPAVGVRWLNSTEPSAPARSYDNVFMAMGLVFNNTLTIQPGLAVPSPTGSKTIYTIAVSINWWK